MTRNLTALFALTILVTGCSATGYDDTDCSDVDTEIVNNDSDTEVESDTNTGADEWYLCDPVATSLGAPDYYNTPDVYDIMSGVATFTRNYEPGENLTFGMDLWTSRDCAPVRNQGFGFKMTMTAPRSVFQAILDANPRFTVVVNGSETVELLNSYEPYMRAEEEYGGNDDVVYGHILFNGMWGENWRSAGIELPKILAPGLQTERSSKVVLPVPDSVQAWSVRSTVDGLRLAYPFSLFPSLAQACRGG